jgi:E3 ubiquitin-protein ligase CHFR
VLGSRLVFTSDLIFQNGGTNCPACRGVSTVATPFRALQSLIDLLLRVTPSKARTERERMQADEVYKVGTSMRVGFGCWLLSVSVLLRGFQIPAPREASPEPNVNQSEYAQPCPHCQSGNPFGWRCPQPIPDPSVDAQHAWHLDDGTPPGHAHCGNWFVTFFPQTPTRTYCTQVKICLPLARLRQQNVICARCHSAESVSKGAV